MVITMTDFNMLLRILCTWFTVALWKRVEIKLQILQNKANEIRLMGNSSESSEGQDGNRKRYGDPEVSKTHEGWVGNLVRVNLCYTSEKSTGTFPTCAENSGRQKSRGIAMSDKGNFKTAKYLVGCIDRANICLKAYMRMRSENTLKKLKH